MIEDLRSSRTGGRRLRAEEWPEISAGEVPLIDGRYLVEREIARGSMGVVYLARDLGLGRRVALKLIAPEEHANHGVDVPTYRALTILREVAAGIAAVHATGMVHRDVKPGNVVIETDSGRPVLVDFGLAMPHDRDHGQAAAGSPPYMAPEQARGETVGPSADVYAFGATAFELLTGRLPFEDETIVGQLRAHQLHAPPSLSSIRPNLRVFDRVIDRMLAKSPHERYEGFASVIAALDQASARWRSGSTEPAPSYPEGAGPGRGEILRIMVVDDDDAFRKVAARAAQLAFYRRQVSVSVARSGVEALSKAEKGVPDLVLLDLSMDGLDGVETISRLRAMKGGTETRVVVVTDRRDDAERWRFGILGVNDFFSKQQALVELVDSITRIGERFGWLGQDDEPEAPPSSRSL